MKRIQTKKMYEKPSVEVVKLQMQGVMLQEASATATMSGTWTNETVSRKSKFVEVELLPEED